jgi:hypothetical protein
MKKKNPSPPSPFKSKKITKNEKNPCPFPSLTVNKSNKKFKNSKKITKNEKIKLAPLSPFKSINK